MGAVAFILILFFIIVGCYFSYQNEVLSVYDKQRKRYEKNQKRYYKLVNRAISKFNKNKTLDEEELKVLKRHVKEGLRENPNNLTLLAVKQHIFSEEELSQDNGMSSNVNTNIKDNLYEENVTDNDDEEYFTVPHDVYQVIQEEKMKKTAERFKEHCNSLTSKSYKYNPAIGREKELEELMMAILTPGKSAIIIGQPRSW